MNGSLQQTTAESDPFSATADVGGPGVTVVPLGYSALAADLRKVARLERGWNGYDAPAPRKESVEAAAALVRLLPRLNANLRVRVGIDGDGDIYLRFISGESEAYLTIEPKSLHFISQYKDTARNQRVDNVPFDGKRLPTKIRSNINEFGESSRWQLIWKRLTPNANYP